MPPRASSDSICTRPKVFPIQSNMTRILLAEMKKKIMSSYEITQPRGCLFHCASEVDLSKVGNVPRQLGTRFLISMERPVNIKLRSTYNHWIGIILNRWIPYGFFLVGCGFPGGFGLSVGLGCFVGLGLLSTGGGGSLVAGAFVGATFVGATFVATAVGCEGFSPCRLVGVTRITDAGVWVSEGMTVPVIRM